MRSDPGSGRLVDLHYLSDMCDRRSESDGLGWWNAPLAEDYAVSCTPIVVKIDPAYPPGEAARHLADLAEMLRHVVPAAERARMTREEMDELLGLS